MDLDTILHLPLEPSYICEETKQGIKLIKTTTGESCCTKNVKVCCTSPDAEAKHEVPVVKRGRGRPIKTEPIHVTQVPSKAEAELVGISGKELTELKKQRKTELNTIASRKARKKRNARLSKIQTEEDPIEKRKALLKKKLAFYELRCKAMRPTAPMDFRWLEAVADGTLIPPPLTVINCRDELQG